MTMAPAMMKCLRDDDGDGSESGDAEGDQIEKKVQQPRLKVY